MSGSKRPGQFTPALPPKLPSCLLSLERLCRNDKKPMAVMLSAAKHLAFSVTYEDEILRLLPQDDIPTQSPTGEDRGEGAD